MQVRIIRIYADTQVQESHPKEEQAMRNITTPPIALLMLPVSFSLSAPEKLEQITLTRPLPLFLTHGYAWWSPMRLQTSATT